MIISKFDITHNNNIAVFWWRSIVVVRDLPGRISPVDLTSQWSRYGKTVLWEDNRHRHKPICKLASGVEPVFWVLLLQSPVNHITSVSWLCATGKILKVNWLLVVLDSRHSKTCLIIGENVAPGKTSLIGDFSSLASTPQKQPAAKVAILSGIVIPSDGLQAQIVMRLNLHSTVSPSVWDHHQKRDQGARRNVHRQSPYGACHNSYPGDKRYCFRQWVGKNWANLCRIWIFGWMKTAAGYSKRRSMSRPVCGQKKCHRRAAQFLCVLSPRIVPGRAASATRHLFFEFSQSSLTPCK